MNQRITQYRDEGILLEICTPIQNTYETGKGTLFCISGYCYDFTGKILAIQPSMVPPVSMGIQYYQKVECPDNRIRDPQKNPPDCHRFLFSFFLRPNDPTVQITIDIICLDKRKVHFVLGEVTPIIVNPDAQRHESHLLITSFLHDIIEESSTPPVIIGLATYNPDIQLFTRQIDSIIKQSHSRWLCIINDDCSDITTYKKVQEIIDKDSRFILLRNDTNLGFYKNFERILQYIPNDAPYIALSDQDDYWYEEKISTLLSSFDNETVLTFSDMRIVNREGNELFPSFWMNRIVHYRELDLQILDNCITGAACMFRGSLLGDILPFPPDAGIVFNDHKVAFHDHWIGCVALAKGVVKFVHKPLYDYIQQGNNCVGHTYYLHEGIFAKVMGIVKEILNRRINAVITYPIKCFLTHGIQRIFFASTLQVRNIAGNRQKSNSICKFCLLNKKLGFNFLPVLWEYKNKRNITCDSEKIFIFGYVVCKLFRII